MCADPACSPWTDDRLAAAPQTASGQIMARNGRGWYQLSSSSPGFVVSYGGRHQVMSRPPFQLPLLRTFIDSDTPGLVEATPEGVPIEDYPPNFDSLHVQTVSGWNALRGPTEKAAVLRWDGYVWVVEAPKDGQLRGPLEMVDELVLIGTAGQSGCDEFEKVQRLNPQDGFVIGDGRRHTTISCPDERQPQLAGDIKVYSLMACTSKGPIAVPLPSTGIIAMCGGNLISLEAPVYDARDQADGKIPSGKTVGSFIAGATLETDADGCLFWKRPNSTSTGTTAQSQKLHFYYTGTQQYATAPEWATKMVVKCWGAPGSNDDGARGGTGGFTQGVFPVAGGAQFSIIVGQGPVYNGLAPRLPYIFGFGGLESADSHQEPGGGMGAVFTGATSPIYDIDDARALIIAGGGGGAGATNPGQGFINGGNGNAPTAGGMPNFHGAFGVNGDPGGAGCGGGGFRGGAANSYAGRGGTGYLHPSKISGEVTASADASAPGSSDPDYAGGTYNPAVIGGHGKVVIEFLAS